MSASPRDQAFDPEDRTTVADTPAVAYEAVVAKLSAEHPELSVVEVEAMVQSENEAHLGGAPLVVPEEVISNVEELIEERGQADS